jgi:flavin reductase (DIM6/NTAB) family NADH-FMN oxidoreductase RutF
MSGAFEVELATLAARDRYKLLCALVVPRPIALVTTLGPGGIVNAAPFSFFNVFSEDPPIIALGFYGRPEGGLKDTSTHIRDIGFFVVNLIDEALAARMNICAVDFPPHISGSTRPTSPPFPAPPFRYRGSRRLWRRSNAVITRRWSSVRIGIYVWGK